MIEVKELSKSYGLIKAVDKISFAANDGEILGFLGPNGAGKSTTMNMITGCIGASAGTVLINGIDVSEDPISAKKNIGYLPEQPPLYPEMTVDEYLNFVYGLKRCKMPRRSHFGEICGLTGINDVRGRVIRNLSKGYRQRVGLAGALVGNPNTLILDEPTVGLDPKQIIDIRSLVKKLGRNHTVLLSSHILTEVQTVCDRIVVINKGKIAADDTAENLSKSLSGENSMTIRVEGEEKDVKSVLERISGVKEVRARGEVERGVIEYELLAGGGADIRREVFKCMAARNFPILLMRTSGLTLEEIFLKLTTGDFYGNGEDE